MSTRALPAAYLTAYAAGLSLWKEAPECRLEQACLEFQRAALALAGVEGARFVRLDALFCAFKVASTLSLLDESDESSSALASATGDHVLDLVEDPAHFGFRTDDPRYALRARGLLRVC